LIKNKLRDVSEAFSAGEKCKECGEWRDFCCFWVRRFDDWIQTARGKSGLIWKEKLKENELWIRRKLKDIPWWKAEKIEGRKRDNVRSKTR
jgi:hypothetical protein